MLKKFRAEIRSLGVPPPKTSPVLKRMSKFMDCLSGLKDCCSPGAISAQLFHNLCNAQIILGMRRVGKNTDERVNTTWILMSDEEYMQNYFDADIDLTPDENALLASKGLSNDFQIDEVILKCEELDELRTDPLESHSASENDFAEDFEVLSEIPADSLLVPLPSANKRFKPAEFDSLRSKPKINYNELVNQRKQKVDLEAAAILKRAQEDAKNSKTNKMDELLKKVDEYESDPDWLFCKSLCANLKDLTAAEKNNIKFDLLQLASKRKVELLLSD